MNNSLVFTCEHGGNRIPTEYQGLFRGQASVLKSHRGWDRGALVLARQLSSELKGPLVFSETSRLLIDLNRSLHHPRVFSEFTHNTDQATRQQIIQQVYLPYRRQAEKKMETVMKKQGIVLHFSIHTFVPELNNIPRNTDIGLLYDPQREGERALCLHLQDQLQSITRRWRVRRNYPYRGVADGFTTWLRKKFPGKNYIGIEIEVNQKHASSRRDWRDLCEKITEAMLTVTESST